MLTTLLLAALAGEHAKTHAGCKEPIALVDWAASDLLTRKGAALLAKSLRDEHKGLPRVVWQTFETMDLPPATSALRASMQVANPRWKFHLVHGRPRAAHIHRTALSPGLTCWPCHCYAARFSSTSARRAATLAALYNCTVHSDATVSPVAGGGAPAAHRQDAEGVLHRHELRLHSLEARRQRARHQYEDGAAHRRGRD